MLSNAKLRKEYDTDYEVAPAYEFKSDVFKEQSPENIFRWAIPSPGTPFDSGILQSEAAFLWPQIESITIHHSLAAHALDFHFEIYPAGQHLVLTLMIYWTAGLATLPRWKIIDSTEWVGPGVLADVCVRVGLGKGLWWSWRLEEVCNHVFDFILNLIYPPGISMKEAALGADKYIEINAAFTCNNCQVSCENYSF